MKKYRYRCEAGSTRQGLNRLKHIEKLGPLLHIMGKRFHSIRNNVPTTHECVYIIGQNGTARYNGCFCWSYGGEGPRGLVELLKACGLKQQMAEDIAFRSKRHGDPGVDWYVAFGGGDVGIGGRRGARWMPAKAALLVV